MERCLRWFVSALVEPSMRPASLRRKGVMSARSGVRPGGAVLDDEVAEGAQRAAAIARARTASMRKNARTSGDFM